MRKFNDPKNHLDKISDFISNKSNITYYKGFFHTDDDLLKSIIRYTFSNELNEILSENNNLTKNELIEYYYTYKHKLMIPIETWSEINKLLLENEEQICKSF
jgi:hypothetical protein